MAASASDSPTHGLQVMEEDLTCYICYDLLDDPKELDCPHIFCFKCLLDWVGKQSIIECPECRRVTKIPPGGLANLKINLRIKNMVEKYTLNIEKRKTVPICQIHEGERQHFYCETCGVTVCQACLVLKHKMPIHDIKELKEITVNRKTQMGKILDKVKKEVDKGKSDEQKLEQIEKEVQLAVEREMEKVDQRYTELITEIQAKQQSVKKRIRKIGDERLDQVTKKKSEIKDRVKRLQNAYATAQRVVDTAADHLYLTQHASLVDKMEKLCVAEHQIPNPHLEDIAFKSGTSVGINFGNIKTRKLRLITEFGNFDKAQSISSSQSGLIAVLDARLHKVVVYRRDNSDYKMQFIITSNIESPNQVALSSNDNIFITEKGASVKVFSSTGRYERTSTSMKGLRLSATQKKIVMVPVSKDALIIHNNDGEILTKHRISVKATNQVSSDGKKIAYCNREEDKVCVIDFGSGLYLNQFDVKNPAAICFDCAPGSLLIGYSETNKNTQHNIGQFCSTTGRLLACLATGLYNPLAMTVTPDKRLAVVDFRSVKVFDIE